MGRVDGAEDVNILLSPAVQVRATDVSQTHTASVPAQREKRHGKRDERACEPPPKRGCTEAAAVRGGGGAVGVAGKKKKAPTMSPDSDPQVSGGSTVPGGDGGVPPNKGKRQCQGIDADAHEASGTTEGATEAPQGGGRVAARPVRAGTRQVNYSEVKRRGPRGPRKTSSTVVYVDRHGDTGGRVALRRGIVVSDVTTDRIVRGAYEWRDGAYAEQRRAVSDDGG